VARQQFMDRLKHAWNAFSWREKVWPDYSSQDLGSSYGKNQAHTRMRILNERTIINSIYTRLSVDCASVGLRHVTVDDYGKYQADVKSGLNDCLRVEANVDQAARAFRQDMYLTMLDVGHIAVVPVDTTLDPTLSGSYDVQSLRVGTVTQWYPRHVTVRLYNDQVGRRQEVTLPKNMVAIVENPFYAIMNEPNSTFQRLMRKLALLDTMDEQTASGKLDLIIQLPYVVKTEERRKQAQQRAKEVEFQLKGSTYGIAYTDGTEKITQLNRPATNNLLDQIQYLVETLYNQLGLTPEIMNGTASESAILEYWNRTIEPLVSSVVEAFHRVFLTKTARTQGQAVMAMRDLFKIIPITMKDLATIADKLSRNEIMSSNEFRSVIGLPPSKDPKADQLSNKNMPQGGTGSSGSSSGDSGAGPSPSDEVTPPPENQPSALVKKPPRKQLVGAPS
jgi:Phage portal protein